jgi:ribosomal protein S18 acetylase RimI-like enzyme
MQENQPDAHIRRATADDAWSIASVLHASFVEYESSYTAEAFAATTPTREQVQHRMSEGPIWVALQGDTIVGAVSVVLKSDTVYIRGMAILPTARGQRIGTLLLQQVEAYASGHGYRRLFLSTTPFLTRAIRLYEHRGFQRSDEGPHDLFGTPLFTMVKTLKAEDDSS